jgi:hypothetical protein
MCLPVAISRIMFVRHCAAEPAAEKRLSSKNLQQIVQNHSVRNYKPVAAEYVDRNYPYYLAGVDSKGAIVVAAQVQMIAPQGSLLPKKWTTLDAAAGQINGSYAATECSTVPSVNQHSTVFTCSC